MRTRKAIAVLCSDLHLCEKAPIARSLEENWLEVQRYGLEQIRALANTHGVPILCAGDIFHKWNASAKVINFALDHLPNMYAVPGQHDLPYHQMDLMDDCAFGTLLRAGKIKLLEHGRPRLIRGAYVWGFPWGSELDDTSGGMRESGRLDVAIVHAYIWTHTHGFTGAPEDKRVSAYKDKLQGFDVAVFGDNHRGFAGQAGKCLVWNNGGFLRRNIDEQTYRPRIGILWEGGEVTPHFLNCDHDKFMDKEQALIEEEANHSMQKFLQLLNEANAHPADFHETLKEYFHTYEVSKGAQRIILEALEPK